MSIKRSGSQILFESLFTRGANPPFRQIKKEAYSSTAIGQAQAANLRGCLRSEAQNLYYKALVSFFEAINSVVQNSFSWPTVELYYSTFYSTKAFLNVYEYAILRAERRLYYIRARASEKFLKCNNTTDHKATFEVLNKHFKGDYLLSNQIDCQSAYDWIMEKRDDTNYRDLEFHEPQPPDFWEKINQELASQSIWDIVERISSDSAGLYCFQSDYAILGIPIKRLETTCDALKKTGISTISNEQLLFLKSFIPNCPESFLSRVI